MPLSHASSASAFELGLRRPVQYSLENGLSVVLQRDERRPRVAVAVAYRVGTRDDPEGYRGLAHLTEHMAFRGSRHLDDGEAMSAIEDVGGSANAATTTDNTIYFAELPAAHLPRALWIESERMAFTLEAMSEEHADVECEVVGREWSLRRKNNVGARLAEFVQHEKSPPGHVYRHVDDLETDVDGMELDHVRWFFQQHYRPSNATLVVVGDFNEGVARHLIERYFGPIGEPTTRTQRPDAPAVAFGGRAQLTLASPVIDARIEMHWSIPCRRLECISEMLLASHVLASERTGMLGRALSEAGLPNRLAMNVVLHPEFMEVVLVNRLDSTKQAHTALLLLEEHLERARRERVDSDSLGMAKQAFATAFLERHDSALHLALQLAEEPNVHLQPLLERVMDVTPDSLRTAIARKLPDERRLVVVLEHNKYATEEGELVGREGDLRPHAYRVAPAGPGERASQHGED